MLKFKNNRIRLCIFILFELIAAIIVTAYLIIRIKHSYQVNGYMEKWIGAVIVVIVLAAMVIGIVLTKNLKIETIYFIIFSTLGLLYMIVLPFLRVHDEGAHFVRAYEISRGHLLTQNTDLGVGRELPKEIGEIEYGNTKVSIENLKEDWKIELTNSTFIQFPTSAIVAPTNYISQIIGIKFASMFTSKLVAIAYMGRITKFLVTGILFWAAIKFIPYGKKVILVLALLPRNLHESISLAPDGYITALFCVLVAFVLYLKFEYEGRMKWQHYLLMYLLTGLVSLCKFVYTPILLLFFLIPKDRFFRGGGIKDYIFSVGTAIAVAIGFSIAWGYICGQYGLNFGTNVDSAKQFSYILKNPFKIILILYRTIKVKLDWYIQTMLGNWLGWLNIGINSTAIAITGWTLLYNAGKMICKFDKINISWIVISAAVMSAILIFISLYMTCTEVEHPVVKGVQGRYFIPEAIILSFALLPQKKYDKDEYCCLDSSLLLICTINLYIIIKLLFVCYS